MIIKTVQTLVFEYPEDYQAEIEWNKKRDGDWVHQSRDTMCSVYTLTNNYLIPTKTKHSFLDNPYFEAEPRTEEPSFTATDFGKGTITRYTDEPQTNKDFEVTYTCSFTDCDNFKNFGFGEKCIECKRKQSEVKHKDEPQTEKCPHDSICAKPCKECGACEEECGMWEILKNEPQTENE